MLRRPLFSPINNKILLVQGNLNPHQAAMNWFSSFILSQPQLNHSSTQPNLTKVGFDMKMSLNHHHQPPPTGNSMLAISKLLLIPSWPNFEGSFPGYSLTIDSIQNYICPDNLCLSSLNTHYWHDFDNWKGASTGWFLRACPDEFLYCGYAGIL